MTNVNVPESSAIKAKAIFGGALGESEGRPCDVGVSNVTFASGTATVEDGIYLTEVGGLHAGLNPISGDFNVQGTGFVIKNGKIDRPITLFVVSGNFYEMMNNVELIGNDIEKRFVGVACPTLKIKSLAISGK